MVDEGPPPPSAVVGNLTPYAVPVVVVEHDPAWAARFEAERAAITAALGPVAVTVEHVGSTSVPGLPAKPVIDILLLVPDSSDESAYVSALEAAGYTLRIREPAWLEHRVLYRRVDSGSPHDVNLHVFSPGAADAEIARMRVFRDWLRTHPQDRELYAATKRELATRRWRYVQDYADAKTEVVEEILSRAGAPPAP
ncbi:GrpB family protein [Pedococcus sp. KACC 23699]|uniref:GrpB family protein n=1 Tax=Pedococcus sp. KACC 23699 TaxID=3149228 RepID=A0AAU7JU20_9MICO